ncbi:MAG: Uma2 family endonuclease [Candidatus Solibacter usitatus]|nr:Uma2 family endonuclease [Candidatus Solibacter usitatus]
MGGRYTDRHEFGGYAGWRGDGRRVSLDPCLRALRIHRRPCRGDEHGHEPHAKSQARCARLLDQYFERRRAGYAGTELRCRVTVRGRRRYYQPDVSAVLNDDEPDSRYLDRAPDLVVEVRSPDDTLAEMFRKMEHYFANGARLGWILLPEEKSALILTPNHPVRTATSGDQLDGGKVLPGLRIPAKRLFS